MSIDTQSINKQRQDLSSYDEIWLFGYGSLMYKVDFPYYRFAPATIKGFARRFYQGSHDHRGTVESPGRVATLIKQDDACCFGLAYQVSQDVFEHLDHREKNGYLRYEVPLYFSDASSKLGLVYLGGPDNSAFLGEASISEIAHQIFHSKGPSGANRDYVYDLAKALRAYNEVDEHVFAIEKALIKLQAQP